MNTLRAGAHQRILAAANGNEFTMRSICDSLGWGHKTVSARLNEMLAAGQIKSVARVRATGKGRGPMRIYKQVTK